MVFVFSISLYKTIGKKRRKPSNRTVGVLNFRFFNIDFSSIRIFADGLLLNKSLMLNNIFWKIKNKMADTSLNTIMTDDRHERINALLKHKEYMNVLVKVMSVFGHDSWLCLGESVATVNAALTEEIQTQAERIITEGWNKFSSEMIESTLNGGTVPVDVSDFVGATLSLPMVMRVANNMYAQLPASESYAYVGDQFET